MLARKAAFKLIAAFAMVLFATVPIGAAQLIWPAADWATATPAEMGMDPAQLELARDYALSEGGAGYITRGGKLVMSWGDLETTYELKSSAKSIGVTALGLALEDGLVGLHDRAQVHLSEFGLPPESNGTTGWLEEVTLLQLATHTAGFVFAPDYGDIAFEPGITWSYSDGGANWLADVLTVVFDRDLRDLLFERVFDPLGITEDDLTWRDHLYRDDTIRGIKRREFASGIDANVDAMARLGYLYLRRGLWNGQRILGESFVDAASRPVPEVVGLPVENPASFFNASDHYGLLWWNNGDGAMPGVPSDAYWSWGVYDSLIVVIPSLDIVAVRAGGGWRPEWFADYTVVEPFIRPIAASANCAGATDHDGDGVGGVCDCDDANASTHPGASEVNDGADNHCVGDQGHGLVDELSGVTGFYTSRNRNRFSWPAQTGATRYEVARSPAATFADGCVTQPTAEPQWFDTAIPAAGGVFFYVVRPLEPYPGSWGIGEAGAERTLDGC